MDTISHVFWGKGLFGYRKYGSYSILFGAYPDLSSFGLYFLYNLIFNLSNFKFGKPPIETIPEWVISFYNFSHSLVISITIISLVYIFFSKDFWFPMLAWPFHIVLDFFTHSIEYFPTPIFWPISDYKFNGIPWSNSYILFFNFLFLLFLFFYRKKQFLLRH